MFVVKTFHLIQQTHFTSSFRFTSWGYCGLSLLAERNSTADEDSVVQPYRFEPESDPEQEKAPEQVREVRAQQDVSEW